MSFIAEKKINYSLPVCLLLLFSLSSCFCIRVKKNIIYDEKHQLALDIYAPRKVKSTAPVLVFMHGGSWMHGRKSIYRFFGRGMARKGIVTVVIDYRLYPDATITGIVEDAATSVKWTRTNIALFGGDPKRIFVAGHSAGGQMAALIATDTSFFPPGAGNPVKGIVLIDPFGLDMYNYFNVRAQDPENQYRPLFGTDPLVWKKESPFYHLHQDMPPFLMFVGGKTNSNIITDAANFAAEVRKYQPGLQLITVPRRRHAGMIFSFLSPFKPAYRQIRGFMGM